VTADLPTVFYLRRKILDIGVGKKQFISSYWKSTMSQRGYGYW
jgi:hypothetical protein